jgi:hypothetical protein
MFGLSTPNEVKEVAKRLKDATERINLKYQNYNAVELSAAIEREFPEELREVRPDYINFVLMELPHFVFSINPTKLGKSSVINLSVHGQQKYQGFGLITGSDGWLSFATDSLYIQATSDAKKLAAWMEKAFGAKDISKHSNELWR